MILSHARRSALREVFRTLPKGPLSEDSLHRLVGGFTKDAKETALIGADVAQMFRLLSKRPDGVPHVQWNKTLVDHGVRDVASSVATNASLLQASDVPAVYAFTQRYDFLREGEALEPIMLDHLPNLNTRYIVWVLSRPHSTRIRSEFLSRLRLSDCSSQELQDIAHVTHDEAVKAELAARPTAQTIVGSNHDASSSRKLRATLDVLSTGRSLSLDDIGPLLKVVTDKVKHLKDGAQPGDATRYVSEIAHLIRIVRRSQPADIHGWNKWRIFLLKSKLPELVDLLTQYGAQLSPRDASTSYTMLRTLGLTKKATQLEPILLDKLDTMDVKAIVGVLLRSSSQLLTGPFLARLNFDDCSAEMLQQLATKVQNEDLIKAMQDRGLEIPACKASVTHSPLQKSLDEIDPVRVASFQAIKKLMHALKETLKMPGCAVTPEQSIAVLTFAARRPVSLPRWKKVLQDAKVEEIFEACNFVSFSARELSAVYKLCRQLEFDKHAENVLPYIGEKAGTMKPAHKAIVLSAGIESPLREKLLRNLVVTDLSTNLLTAVAAATSDARVLEELGKRDDWKDIKVGLRIQLAHLTQQAPEHSELCAKLAQSFTEEEAASLDDENLLLLYALQPTIAWPVIDRDVRTSVTEGARWPSWHPNALDHLLQLAAAIQKHDCMRARSLDCIAERCSHYVSFKHKNFTAFTEDEAIGIARLFDVTKSVDTGAWRQLARNLLRIFSKSASQAPYTRWTDFRKCADALRHLRSAMQERSDVFERHEKDFKLLRTHLELMVKDCESGICTVQKHEVLDFFSDCQQLCGRVWDAAFVRVLVREHIELYTPQELWTWWIMLRECDIPEELRAKLTAETAQALTWDEICAILEAIGPVSDCPILAHLHDHVAKHTIAAVERGEEIEFPTLSDETDRYVMEQVNPRTQLRLATTVERLHVLRQLLVDSEAINQWYEALSVETVAEAHAVLRAAAVIGGYELTSARTLLDAAFRTLLRHASDLSAEEAAACAAAVTALPAEWSRAIDINITLAKALQRSLHPWTVGTWAWWTNVRLASPTAGCVLERCFPLMSSTFKGGERMTVVPAGVAPPWLSEFIEQQHGSIIEQYPVPETPLVASLGIEQAKTLIFVDESPRFEDLGVDKMLHAMGWNVQRKTKREWKECVERP